MIAPIRRLSLAPLLAVALTAAPPAPRALAADGVEQALRTALVDTLRERHRLGSDARLDIEELQAARRGALAGASAVVALDVPRRSSVDGPITFRATVRHPSRGVEKVWVRARVAALLPTVVARHDVPRGAQLTLDDLELAQRPDRPGRVADAALAVGRLTRRALREGDAVDGELLRLPAVVRRGDSVAVVVRGRGFSIKTRATALGGGGVGAEVTVRVNRNNRLVATRIVAPGEVEVLP
ncbi:MAG: flagella basal body P-ring formation protein FlgA [Proteobacteria bacterium]|nr:MAG: flagella basal body P-ring formation protein FlgA [Pseudomonadota bacterium]